MKLSHALGFFAIGTVMLILPRFAPGLCPRNGFDGSSGRELWLQVMGMLQTGLGVSGFMRSAWAAVLDAIETWPEAVADFWGSVLPEPELERAQIEDEIFRGAEVVQVNFAAKPDWEQQRAA
jgi:hypothetical protein